MFGNYGIIIQASDWFKRENGSCGFRLRFNSVTLAIALSFDRAV